MDLGIVLLLLVLMFQHFLIDWILQPPWMVFEKHDLKKSGGYIHSFVNTIGFTAIICWYHLLIYGIIIKPLLFLICMALVFISHLFIDANKMRLNKEMGWKCDNSKAFWTITAIDQFLHLAIMIVVAAILI